MYKTFKRSIATAYAAARCNRPLPILWEKKKNKICSICEQNIGDGNSHQEHLLDHCPAIYDERTALEIGLGGKQPSMMLNAEAEIVMKRMQNFMEQIKAKFKEVNPIDEDGEENTEKTDEESNADSEVIPALAAQIIDEPTYDAQMQRWEEAMNTDTEKKGCNNHNNNESSASCNNNINTSRNSGDNNKNNRSNKK